MPPTDITRKLTRADLAFIDAAISMQQASMMKPEGPSVGASDPAACDTVDLALALAGLAVYAWHAYNSCLMGASAADIRAATKLDIKSTVPLGQLVAHRAMLAKALDVK